MRKHRNGEQVLDKAQDLYEESREKAARGMEEAKTFIQEKPVLSALVGVGLGVLLGLWMNRRD